MDIGTGKPDANTLARAPHHLLSFLDPAETYSAADFRRDALRLIGEIKARGNTPLLVGGTMMYFRLLRDGMASMPDADPEVRAAIEAQAHVEGWAAVHTELEKVDPESAARIHPNDPQRLQRALEVYRVSGKTLSAHREPLTACLLPFRFGCLVESNEVRQIWMAPETLQHLTFGVQLLNERF